MIPKKPLKKNNFNYYQYDISLNNFEMKGSSESYHNTQTGYSAVIVINNPNGIAQEALELCKKNYTCNGSL